MSLSTQEELQKKLNRVNKLIEIKQFGLEALEILSQEHRNLSNMGWFMSMLHLEGGTITAVLNGDKTTQYQKEGSILKAEIVQLIAQKNRLECKLEQRTYTKPKPDYPSRFGSRNRSRTSTSGLQKPTIKTKPVPPK